MKKLYVILILTLLFSMIFSVAYAGEPIESPEDPTPVSVDGEPIESPEDPTPTPTPDCTSPVGDDEVCDPEVTSITLAEFKAEPQAFEGSRLYYFIVLVLLIILLFINLTIMEKVNK